MKVDVTKYLNSFQSELLAIKNSQQLNDLKIKYLGRKHGLISNMTVQIPKLPIEEREGIGTLVQKLKTEIEQSIGEKYKIFESSLKQEKVDFTVPGRKHFYGGLHPLTQVIEEVKETFHLLGFTWLDGPEVDTEEYNFEKLNMPADHPSRDFQQTYYIDEKYLLRTHTSNMQVRYLQSHKPPVRVLFPGRVYRRDMPDATHLPSFYQLEGLLVDTVSSMTDLIGVLNYFAKRFFGPKSKIRIYGHNFPYTEPSIEVEVLHEKKGWIEILGAGMVHPKVIENSGLDPQKYRGWAFGMGPERLAMLKFGIDDVRILYQNKIAFLDQF